MEFDTIEIADGKVYLWFSVITSEIQNIAKEAELAELPFYVYGEMKLYELEINGTVLVFYDYQKMEKLHKEIIGEPSISLEELEERWKKEEME